MSATKTTTGELTTTLLWTRLGAGKLDTKCGNCTLRWTPETLWVATAFGESKDFGYLKTAREWCEKQAFLAKIDRYDILQIDRNDGNGWVDYCTVYTEKTAAVRCVMGYAPSGMPHWIKRTEYRLRLVRAKDGAVLLSEPK